jgi:1-deoxy-D-xylulose-5-phosphate synthase
MTILAPRDIGELRSMLRWSTEHDGPCAIRYGKNSVDLNARYPNQESFVPGKWETLERGHDCALLAVGSMVEAAIAVRDLLAEKGIQARLVNASTVKPMDEKLLREIADKPVFTLEEHVRTGGFGAAVCDYTADHGLAVPAKVFALPDAFVTHGSRNLLLEKYGLSPEKIADEIIRILQND